MPPRHDLDTLERMAGHVGYELKRAAFYSELGPPVDIENAQLIGEAVLEAYLIHVRNVHDFLTKPISKRETDVVAADYFDDPWALRAKVLPESRIVAIHRRIAHITTDRQSVELEGETYNWGRTPDRDRSHWARVVKRAFGRFLGDLRTIHPARATWFDLHWKHASDALDRR